MSCFTSRCTSLHDHEYHHNSFLIHSLRLNYLRKAEDPYGPRIISLDPSYQKNPYVLASGMADIDHWRELAAPQSPPITDDESDSRPSGFPGARLKYTTTIMGPRRVGAMGLRVSGKRDSVSKASLRRSLLMEKDGKGASPDDPIQIDVAEPTPTDQPSPKLSSKMLAESPIVSMGGSTEVATPTTIKSAPPPPTPQDEPRPPPQNVTIPFIPKFKGAEAMAARRRIRLMNRGGAPMRPAMIAPAAHLNPELSSSSESESDVPEEEEPSAESSDSDFDDDDAPDVDDSIADEFDP